MTDPIKQEVTYKGPRWAWMFIWSLVDAKLAETQMVREQEQEITEAALAAIKEKR